MTSANKVLPLENRVLISVEKETRSQGGIYIPDTATKERPMEGKVIAVGPGKRYENGQIAECRVKAGDTVLFGKYAGTEVKFDDKDYVIMREEDILAIIK